MQRSHIDTDVLIVGGGLAGCSLGYLLASAGRDVLVIERQDASLKSKLCAGVFDTHNFSVDEVFGAGFLGSAGAHAHPCAHARPGQKWFRATGKIICVERKALDDAAMRSCLDAGASLLDRMRVERIDLNAKKAALRSLRDGGDVTVSFHALVGADGAASQVRRLATGSRQRVIPSLQCTVKTTSDVALMEHFDDAVGYCWHFPFSPDAAYVGICAYSPMSASELKDRLDSFCRRRGFALGELKGAPIPSGDDVLLECGEDAWLVGDAAGLNYAGLGCGMQFACASAKALSRQLLEGASYVDAMESLRRHLDIGARNVRARIADSPAMETESLTDDCDKLISK